MLEIDLLELVNWLVFSALVVVLLSIWNDIMKAHIEPRIEKYIKSRDETIKRCKEINETKEAEFRDE